MPSKQLQTPEEQSIDTTANKYPGRVVIIEASKVNRWAKWLKLSLVGVPLAAAFLAGPYLFNHKPFPALDFVYKIELVLALMWIASAPKKNSNLYMPVAILGICLGLLIPTFLPRQYPLMPIEKDILNQLGIFVPLLLAPLLTQALARTSFGQRYQEMADRAE